MGHSSSSSSYNSNNVMSCGNIPSYHYTGGCGGCIPDYTEELKISQNQFRKNIKNINVKMVTYYNNSDAKILALKKTITDKMTEFQTTHIAQLQILKENQIKKLRMLDEQKEINKKNSTKIEELATKLEDMSNKIQNIGAFIERATKTYKDNIHKLEYYVQDGNRLIGNE